MHGLIPYYSLQQIIDLRFTTKLICMSLHDERWFISPWALSSHRAAEPPSIVYYADLQVFLLMYK